MKKILPVLASAATFNALTACSAGPEPDRGSDLFRAGDTAGSGAVFRALVNRRVILHEDQADTQYPRLSWCGTCMDEHENALAARIHRLKSRLRS